MEAHVLSLNNFNMPKVFKNDSAEYINIVYLLLLEKGKFQSHPDMGIGLKSRYRYVNDGDVLSNLQSDIKSQVEKYLPDVQHLENVSVGLIDKDKALGIIMETRNGVYALSYDIAKDTITTADTHVLDELNV